MRPQSTAELLNRLVAAEINRHDAAPLPAELTSQQWGMLYNEARRQTVIALTLNAIEQHPELAATMPVTLAAQWMAEAEKTRRRHEASLRAESSLLQAFGDAGIHPIVLKGNTLARLYPDPSARQCGDIDLFIRPDGCRATDSFLAAAGITPTQHSDGSRSFIWQQFEVELHYRFFDIHSSISRRRLRKLFSATPSLTLTSPESTLLMLSAHILKHAIGRGIGLRQLADFAVASQRFKDEIDPVLMQRITRAAGLTRWTSTLFSFLVTHLALPRAALPFPGITISPKKGDRLHRIIVRGGNFGQHAEGRGTTSPIATAASFAGAAGFSLRTAPAEALATVSTLTHGRLSNMFHHHRRNNDK